MLQFGTIRKPARNRIVFLFLILIVAGGTLDAQENEWEFLYSQDAIDVYRRPRPQIGLDEFWAIATLDCRLDVIAMVLKDFANYPNWMPECLQAELIERIDQNSLLLYYRHNSPWPVKNRDAILEVSSRIDTSDKTLYISSIAVTDQRFPPQSSPVRMALMEAHWIITARDRQHTRIDYRIVSDPAGRLPAAAVNYATQALPPVTLRGLSQMAQQKCYIEAAQDSPERKIVDDFFPE